MSSFPKAQAAPDYGELQVPEAEAGALGAVLLDKSPSSKLLSQLEGSMFADLRHKKIFKVMKLLQSKNAPVDELTLISHLKRNKEEDEAGGIVYITKLEDSCPSELNFPFYLDQLKDFDARRKLFYFAKEAQEQISDKSKDAVELLESFNRLGAETLRKTVPRKPVIQFVSPTEAREYQPEREDLLVGDQHIARGSITVIGGPPGVGKSRAATALAMAGATGGDWLGLKIHTQFKTMIIQAENNPMRVKKDFSEIPAEQVDEYIKISYPPPLGLAFDREYFKAAIIEAAEEFNPDLIIVDPWNQVVKDDGVRDYRESLRNIQECIGSESPPALAIVSHTKKPKDNEKKMGRDLLHELSGSHFLGSAPRSVFVMLPASNDPTDDRVIWENPKNNDGEMTKRSAWYRKNSLFVPCEDFDWDQYSEPKVKRKGISELDIKDLFGSGERKLEKADAAKELMEKTGLGKSAVYDALKSDGKFGEYLQENDDGLMEWVNQGLEAFPVSASGNP